MASDDSYLIREARPDEKTTIVSFIEQLYVPRESINRMYLKRNAHKIDETQKALIADDVKNTYGKLVANLPCIVAVHKETNEIVGLTLMQSANKSLAEHISPVQDTPPLFKSKLLDEIMKYVITPALNSIDFFAEFPTHRTSLKLLYLCVSPDHCGRNLASRLVKEVVKYAENKGIGFVYGLCMSPYSRKATEKNGFKKLSDMDIVSCRGSEGNLVFDGEESCVISIMAKETNYI